MSNEAIFSTDLLDFFFKFSTVIELVKKLPYMPIFIFISQVVSEIRLSEKKKKKTLFEVSC